MLVAGANAAEAAKAAAQDRRRGQGDRRRQPVSLAENLAENVAAQVLAIARNYSHILFPSTANGKNVAPRVAAMLDVAQISDITKVDSPDTFERPIYAGNAIAIVQSSDAIKVDHRAHHGLRCRQRPPAAAPRSKPSTAWPTAASPASSASEVTKSERPELTAAKIIVSGGRALGSAEKFQEVMAPLADKLNAGLGASRAAVDAGYAPNDWQVGQTGKIVAPQLYIACRHLGRDPASGRHEGLQGDRGDQQGRGGADLLGGRLRPGGRPVHGRAGTGQGALGAPAIPGPLRLPSPTPV